MRIRDACRHVGESVGSARFMPRATRSTYAGSTENHEMMSTKGEEEAFEEKVVEADMEQRKWFRAARKMMTRPSF